MCTYYIAVLVTFNVFLIIITSHFVWHFHLFWTERQTVEKGDNVGFKHFHSDSPRCSMTYTDAHMTREKKWWSGT